MLMTKGLMDWSLHQKMALERVREKAKLTEKELFELRNWKVVTEQKLKLAERTRDEYQKMTEELKIVREDKENELRLAKEKAVQEYRDSDALLTELGVSYNDDFDDVVRPKLFTPSLTSQPSTSMSRRLRPFSPILLMIQMNFLQRKGPSPSSSRFMLKKESPLKPKIPSFLTCRHNYLLFSSILKTIWILPVVCRAALYSLYLTFNLFI